MLLQINIWISIQIYGTTIGKFLQFYKKRGLIISDKQGSEVVEDKNGKICTIIVKYAEKNVT